MAGNLNATPGEALDELRQPVSLYVAKDGKLYVADRGNHRVMKYAPNRSRNGTSIGDGRGNGSHQFDCPTAVVVDETRNAVYISDYGNNRIQRWSETGVETVVGIRGQDGSDIDTFYKADDIQLDPRSDEALYILDRRNIRLSRWRLNATRYGSSFIVSNRSLGIYVDGQQNVFTAECDGNQILQRPSENRVAGTGQNGNALNQLNCPSAVAVDRDGSMFIADTQNHRIMRWYLNAAEGICIAGCPGIGGSKADQLAEPTDLTFDQEGNLLVADTGNHRIQLFDSAINPQCGE